VSMMDHLEKIAYNALPTQIDDEYMNRQYYQQANQVMITRHNRNFVTAYDGTDQCYGLLTGYPCCTTNMHQGWPKFVQSLWFATEDKGLAALVFGASEVNAKVADGTEIKFIEETSYPFNDEINFTYKSKKQLLFPLHLRIPSWCNQATITINGEKWTESKGGQIIKINRKWKDGDIVTLTLPMVVTTSRWFNNSVAVDRGPLVYALKVEEDWKNVIGTDRYGSYKEVRPLSQWNYGLAQSSLKNIDSGFQVSMKKNISDQPWNLSNAPIEIKTKGKLIPEWKLYNETAGPLPYSNIEYLKNEPEIEITLIPYGCTTLRISQFPVVE
jgi:hypothetical protein